MNKPNRANRALTKQCFTVHYLPKLSRKKMIFLIVFSFSVAEGAILRDELDNPLFVGQMIVSDRYCEAMSLLIEGMKCDKNGKFIQPQCLDDECFCVDINNGDKLTPIRFNNNFIKKLYIF